MKSKLHPNSFEQVNDYLERAAQALIITGLSQTARNSVLEFILSQVTVPEQIIHLESDKKSLSIDQVKQLFGRLHRRSDRPEPLVVAIAEAHKLTLPAQNALLKLLEEPPAHVRFILAAPRPDRLLPTIRSRCQQIMLHPLDEARFKQIVDTASLIRSQLYALSSGDPFLAVELADDASSQAVVAQSRRLLQEPLGQASIELVKLAKDGQSIEMLIMTFGQIARLGLERAANDQDRRLWLKRLTSVVAALDNLGDQLNQKLVLDQLLLEFRAA